MQFSSFNTFIHVSCYSYVLFICWLNKFKFSVKILSFGFHLFNSQCGANLAVDHNLVYSYSKMFLLSFILILSLILVLKPSFSIHMSDSSFLLLDLLVELEFCHQLSPACQSCSSISDSQWMLIHTNQRHMIISLCPCRLIIRISLSAQMFLFCFYLWPYILNVKAYVDVINNIFSIIIQVFRNLFLKYGLYLGKF